MKSVSEAVVLSHDLISLVLFGHSIFLAPSYACVCCLGLPFAGPSQIHLPLLLELKVIHPLLQLGRLKTFLWLRTFRVGGKNRVFNNFIAVNICSLLEYKLYNFNTFKIFIYLLNFYLATRVLMAYDRGTELKHL